MAMFSVGLSFLVDFVFFDRKEIQVSVTKCYFTTANSVYSASFNFCPDLQLSMVSVVERPWPNMIIVAKEVDIESSLNPADAVLFVGISLVLGIASRHLLRGTKVPYTVALLVLGIITMRSIGL
ncbi:hypothetical protein L1887_28631 [Cichorium endivia]|nr:hypothetical protein L1887_28631 [Cichorium endivia]